MAAAAVAREVDFSSRDGHRLREHPEQWPEAAAKTREAATSDVAHDALALIERGASRRTAARSAFEWSLLPGHAVSVASYIEVAHLGMLTAIAEAHAGRGPAAAQALLAVMQLGGDLTQGGRLFECMFGRRIQVEAARLLVRLTELGLIDAKTRAAIAPTYARVIDASASLANALRIEAYVNADSAVQAFGRARPYHGAREQAAKELCDYADCSAGPEEYVLRMEEEGRTWQRLSAQGATDFAPECSRIWEAESKACLDAARFIGTIAAADAELATLRRRL